jgi:hypothetical protein
VRPAKTKRDGDDDGDPERDPHNLASYYRRKAAECLGHADATSDPLAKEEWITLANGWIQLALQTKQ